MAAYRTLLLIDQDREQKKQDVMSSGINKALEGKLAWKSKEVVEKLRKESKRYAN